MGLRHAAVGPDGLVVIEATGKIPAYRRAIEQLGWNYSVVATLGHLHEWPASLRHSGICRGDGGDLMDVGRRVARPEVLAHLGQRLASLRPGATVVLATDDDDEGHAIAADVAAVVASAALRVTLCRAYPNAMTREAIAAALAASTPYAPGAEAAGVARRRVDRVIGAAFSDLEGRRPVGRVLSALLDSIDRQPLSTTRAHQLVSDGLIDHVVDRPGRRPELEPSDFRIGDLRRRHAGAPLNFVDAIGALEDDASLDIVSAAALLQDLYISGQIGYPRTVKRGFDTAAALDAENTARRLGMARFATIDAAQVMHDDSGHPAIALTDQGWEAVEMLRPIRGLASSREKALTVLGRRSIEAVMGVLTFGIETSVDDVRCIPRIAGLPWQSRAVPASRTLTVGRAAVDRLAAEGIGRPSTVVAHAAKACRMGWIDSAGTLTAAGRSVLDAAPAGLDAAASRELATVIEQAAARGSGRAGSLAVEWLQDRFPERADAVNSVVASSEALLLPLPSFDEDLENDHAPAFRF